MDQTPHRYGCGVFVFGEEIYRKEYEEREGMEENMSIKDVVSVTAVTELRGLTTKNPKYTKNNSAHLSIRMVVGGMDKKVNG